MKVFYEQGMYGLVYLDIDFKALLGASKVIVAFYIDLPSEPSQS